MFMLLVSVSNSTYMLHIKTFQLATFALNVELAWGMCWFVSVHLFVHTQLYMHSYKNPLSVKDVSVKFIQFHRTVVYP